MTTQNQSSTAPAGQNSESLGHLPGRTETQLEPAPVLRQHTPGPWRMFRTYPAPSMTPKYPESERSGHDRQSFKVADSDETAGNPMCRGNLVAHVYNFTGDAEANARLIAAAPVLLATLETIHANAAESVEWIRHRTAPAIALATGASEADATSRVQSAADELEQLRQRVADLEACNRELQRDLAGMNRETDRVTNGLSALLVWAKEANSRCTFEKNADGTRYGGNPYTVPALVAASAIVESRKKGETL